MSEQQHCLGVAWLTELSPASACRDDASRPLQGYFMLSTAEDGLRVTVQMDNCRRLSPREPGGSHVYEAVIVAADGTAVDAGGFNAGESGTSSATFLLPDTEAGYIEMTRVDLVRQDGTREQILQGPVVWLQGPVDGPAEGRQLRAEEPEALRPVAGGSGDSTGDAGAALAERELETPAVSPEPAPPVQHSPAGAQAPVAPPVEQTSPAEFEAPEPPALSQGPQPMATSVRPPVSEPDADSVAAVPEADSPSTPPAAEPEADSASAPRAAAPEDQPAASQGAPAPTAEPPEAFDRTPATPAAQTANAGDGPAPAASDDTGDTVQREPERPAPASQRVQFERIHHSAFRASGYAVLDPSAGTVEVSVRGLPSPALLGGNFTAYKVWLGATGSRTFLPVGLCTKLLADTYRLSAEGLPLGKYDTVLVSAEEQPNGGFPVGPKILTAVFQ